MIRIHGVQPSGEEVAAITAAIAAAFAPAAEAPSAPRAPWKLAHRRPELDLEDLRAAIRTR